MLIRPTLAAPIRLALALALASCGGSKEEDGPTPVSYGAPAVAYVAGAAVAPNLPVVSGAVGGWAVSPPLPAGLTLDPATGAISGTPTARQAPTVHTITASGADGEYVAKVTIEVVVPPAGPVLVHASRSRTFTVSWSAGDGAGPCRLQHALADGSWHDLAVTPTVHDCDATVADAADGLPVADGWSDAFDATGVLLRVVRDADDLPLATFAERATCPGEIAGSLVPTPDLDEDCDGAWDEVEGGLFEYTGLHRNCFPESSSSSGTWDPTFNPDPTTWRFAHVEPAAVGPGGSGMWQYHPWADQLYGCRDDWYEWWAWSDYHH
jgi:hypothetical protein